MPPAITQLLYRIARCVALLYIGCNAARAEMMIVDTPGSNPEDLHATTTHLYFTAEDGIHGRELWRFDDEGRAELVHDLSPGPASTEFQRLAAAQDALFFVARPSTSDTWHMFVARPEWTHARRANGLPQEVKMHDAAPLGDRLIAIIETLEYGAEIWAGDTADGHFTLLCDTYPNEPSGMPDIQHEFQPLDGRLVFVAAHPDRLAHGALWTTKGTPTSTAPIRSDTGEMSRTPIRSIVGAPIEGGAVLALYDDVQKDPAPNLWLTDGTFEGTRRLADSDAESGLNPREFATTGTHVFFKGATTAHGEELWRTDGTPEGTHMVKDIFPGPASSGAYATQPLGNKAVFVANHPNYGHELWVSDGTEEGTVLLRDFLPGPQDSEPYQLVSYENFVLFSCERPGIGEELWRTDGTPEGTELIKDINPGPSNSEPYYLEEFNGKVYFCATRAGDGTELWETDGTAEGTRIAATINPRVRIIGSSDPDCLTPFNEKLYFLATGPDQSRALWESRGAESTTRPHWPENIASVVGPPQELRVVEQRLTVRDAAGEWWALDLEAEAAERVSAPPDSTGASALDLRTQTFEDPVRSGLRNGQWAMIRGAYYFPGYTPEAGVELWRLGATEKTPQLVRDLLPGPGSSQPTDFIALEDSFLFRAEHLAHGAELWHSDGTADGTRLVSDFRPAPLGSVPQEMVVFENHFFTVTREHIHGFQIMVYGLPDLEAVNTRVLDVFEVTHMRPEQLTVAAEKLFFVSDHPAYGKELWAVDDPQSRPYLVRDIAPTTPIQP